MAPQKKGITRGEIEAAKTQAYFAEVERKIMAPLSLGVQLSPAGVESGWKEGGKRVERGSRWHHDSLPPSKVVDKPEISTCEAPSANAGRRLHRTSHPPSTPPDE